MCVSECSLGGCAFVCLSHCVGRAKTIRFYHYYTAAWLSLSSQPSALVRARLFNFSWPSCSQTSLYRNRSERGGGEELIRKKKEEHCGDSRMCTATGWSERTSPLRWRRRSRMRVNWQLEIRNSYYNRFRRYMTAECAIYVSMLIRHLIIE